jgi:hypothetical protein
VIGGGLLLRALFLLAARFVHSDAPMAGMAAAARWFVKNRLPAPISSQLESALSGSSGAGMAEAARGLGSKFGSQ